MKKKDLVLQLSSKCGLPKDECKIFLNSLLDLVSNELLTTNEFDISGFGKFSISVRSERLGINPTNKERIFIPSTKVIKFRPAKSLKEKVNRPI